MKVSKLVSCVIVVLIFLAAVAVPVSILVYDNVALEPEYFRQAMHDAAATGDLAEIRRVASWCPSAVSVKYNAHSGYLPIHTAVTSHQFDSVRQLVELGTSLDAETTDGKTPLYYACVQGDTEIAIYLIAKGAKTNSTAAFNPLHAAAYSGNIAVMKALLSHGADINLTNRSGSALHMAAVANHSDAVALLLERGARADLSDCDGLMAMDVCALERHHEIIDLMLEKGATKTLIAAICDGDLNEVKQFFRDRPDLINGGPGLGDSTPLHYAAIFGHAQLCSYLVNNGADRSAANSHGFIAAHFACRHKDGGLLRAVCTAELANKQRDCGDTPLHICADADNVDLGSILIHEFHADPNVKGQFGATPLLLAFDRGNYPFCKFMIENGADVNVSEVWPSAPHTPLHHALLDPWKPDLTELLLQKGANPFAKGVGDVTPFDMAQRNEKAKALFTKYVMN